jgi:raffinose/stachyose/melibiose transport system permease protein
MFKRIKSNLQHISVTSACYILLIIYAFITLFPIIWLFFTALKTNSEVYLNPWALPKVPQLENYIEAWNAGKMNIYMKNSIILGLFCTFISLVISCMAAYGITRFKTRVSKYANLYFLFGILVPIHSVIIPLFIIMSKVRLLNTIAALMVIYTTFVLPVSIFLLSSSMSAIPKELEEAAIMDGCGFIKVFKNIIMPVSRPALATVAILNFLFVWNEYIFALIFTGSDAIRTLPVGLANFSGVYGSNYATMAAGVMIAVIPSITIYICMQERVIKGITAGAVKG